MGVPKREWVFRSGIFLGVKVAQRHPDLLYEYVGMGQFVDLERSEALGYEATLADARAEQNEEAIARPGDWPAWRLDTHASKNI